MNATLRRTAAVAALVLAPTLASCGFNEQTDQVYTPAVGVNDRSGSVEVLNALVVSGADGSGTLLATLVNGGTAEDALSQVTGAGEDQSLRVDLGSPVEIPAGQSVRVSEERPISVEGEAVTSGAFIALTLTFDRGEQVTVEVPVVARRGTYADIPVPSVAPATPTPTEHSSGGH